MRTRIDVIEKRCREMLDRHPARSIVFDRSVDLAEGVGAQVRHILQAVAGRVAQEPAVLEHPLLRAGLDQMLLNALLALPNNYSDALAGQRSPSTAPAVVRRAEEFMEANAAEPITISDIVAQCGCSETAIHVAFRRYRGYTPMQFLAARRLQAAREALMAPSPTDTVSSIAYACGFLHLGRFAQEYRRRFGEKPSETLRKAGPIHERRR